MNLRGPLKLIHLTSTSWFILSACYILVFALRQAGGGWWLIASMSGYSVLIVFFLVSLYLSAIFRGLARSQKIKTEHPLTTSFYYLAIYSASPFLGAIMGGLWNMGVSDIRVSSYLLIIATGTLRGTFLVWVIIDPLVGYLEMLLPSSAKHRGKRILIEKESRAKKQLEREELLAEIRVKEEREQARLDMILEPYGEKLAELIANTEKGNGNDEDEAVEIGVKAWQMGGLGCMRQLRCMAMDMCEDKYQKKPFVDYISVWWDGVGSWRNQCVGEKK